MQTEEETLPVASMASKESIYRTRWLMAHNRLHAAVHENSVSLPDLWNDYLKELESSEEVAATPA